MKANEKGIVMADLDREYCLRRADEERELAASSDAGDVAERHSELAGLFELRATDPDTWAALSTQEST